MCDHAQNKNIPKFFPVQKQYQLECLVTATNMACDLTLENCRFTRKEFERIAKHISTNNGILLNDL